MQGARGRPREGTRASAAQQGSGPRPRTLGLVAVDVDGRVHRRLQVLASVVLQRVDDVHREGAAGHLEGRTARRGGGGAARWGLGAGRRLQASRAAVAQPHTPASLLQRHAWPTDSCGCHRRSCALGDEPLAISAAAARAHCAPGLTQAATTAHMEHRAVVEILGELLAVQGGRCDDQLECLGPAGAAGRRVEAWGGAVDGAQAAVRIPGQHAPALGTDAADGAWLGCIQGRQAAATHCRRPWHKGLPDRTQGTPDRTRAAQGAGQPRAPTCAPPAP